MSFVPFLSLRRALLLSTYLTLVAVPPLARADDAACTESAAICGRRAFDAATKAVAAGDWRLAEAQFEEAQRHTPHPVILFNLAVSRARLRKVSAAIGDFDAVLADARTDGALRSRAQKEREEARQLLAHVLLDLADRNLSSVTVDGQAIDVQQEDHVVDPGMHRVRVTTGGDVVLDRDVQLAAGERLRLSLSSRTHEINVVLVQPRPTSPVPSASVPPVRTAPIGAHPGWFYASGAATLVVAGVFLWSALDTQSAFDAYQRDLPQLSLDEANRRVDDGHGRELRTNVLLGITIGAALGSAALAIFAVDWKVGRTTVSLAPTGAFLFGQF